MKILHIYPKNDEMIARHVSTLADGMRASAEILKTDSLGEFKTFCRQLQPNIVHAHGCWQYAIVSAASFARKNGIRVVLSPHGQLEPWVMEEKPLQEKLHKTLLWQRACVERAYAIIAFGKMEQKFLRQLKWNTRIEVVRNSLITNSISQQEMCAQTFAVYQKVLDSNTLEQMDDNTRQLLAEVIKAGIMGDPRWVGWTMDDEGGMTESIDWRRMMLYAEHENIRNYVDYGINILGLHAPAIDTVGTPAYFPENYSRPCPVRQIVGEYMGDETDYLLRIIRQILKKPTMLHLIELTRELYRDTVDDNALNQALEEKRLLKQAMRLMPVLKELTLLDEGYMPLEPIDDRATRQIRKQIATHLKIE